LRRSIRRRALEAFTESGLLVAVVALALVHAVARTLGAELELRVSVVVGAGTWAVYAFDRLVDDRIDRPARAAFVRRNRPWMRAGAALAAGIAVVAGIALPPRAIALLAAVVLLALLHARLRHLPWIKPLYIALAWLAVVVGLPAVLAAAPAARVLADLAPIGLAILANVIGCDVTDGEAEARAIGPVRAWWVARGVALAGVVAAAVGPERGLVWVPLVTLVALAPGPRPAGYTHVLDAALGVGGVLAWFALG
jgi:4-hydroxybenzoate polyprenyltransferase